MHGNSYKVFKDLLEEVDLAQKEMLVELDLKKAYDDYMPNSLKSADKSVLDTIEKGKKAVNDLDDRVTHSIAKGIRHLQGKPSLQDRAENAYSSAKEWMGKSNSYGARTVDLSGKALDGVSIPNYALVGAGAAVLAGGGALAWYMKNRSAKVGAKRAQMEIDRAKKQLTKSNKFASKAREAAGKMKTLKREEFDLFEGYIKHRLLTEDDSVAGKVVKYVKDGYGRAKEDIQKGVDNWRGHLSGETARKEAIDKIHKAVDQDTKEDTFRHSLVSKAQSAYDSIKGEVGSVKSEVGRSMAHAGREYDNFAQNTIGVAPQTLTAALVAVAAGGAALTAWLAYRSRKVGKQKAQKELAVARTVANKLPPERMNKIRAKAATLRSKSAMKEELDIEINDILEELT